MGTKESGCPAFPTTTEHGFNNGEPGMTLRQYAAIKLKVPDSGTDWLDAMITKSVRDDFATKAMQGLLSHPECDWTPLKETTTPQVSSDAYAIADAMLEARK